MTDITYTWPDFEKQIATLCENIQTSNWKPEYIVGITRGGLIPATVLSHCLQIKMYSLDISLRDNYEVESNCWMAEDAYNGKNILIIDDINDTGKTFSWLCNDWQSSCMPGDLYTWDTIWNQSTRFGVLINNFSSNFKKVRYSSINLQKTNEWINFPWENLT